MVPTYLSLLIPFILQLQMFSTEISMTKQITFQSTKDFKSKISVLHYVTITMNTTSETKYRQCIIPFAVADKNYNIVCTRLIEEFIQNITSLQDFTITYNRPTRLYTTIQTPI